MAIEASFTVTEGEFPLAAVFSQFPAGEIELDRLVPTNNVLVPYFWLRDVEVNAINTENITHPGITDIRVVDNVDGEAFIRIDWDFDYKTILTAIIETDVHLVSGIGEKDRWTFELRADTQQALSEFQSYCQQNDIHVELTELHALSPLESGREYDLTDAQQDALITAYALGYFDSPRQATQEDVAEELDISRQAAGSRLRRGTRRLVSSTLIRDEG